MEDLFILLVILVLIAICLVLCALRWRSTRSFGGVAVHFPTPPELVGPLAPNKLLSNAEILLKGQIQGPESILVEGNTLYTGTGDARIVKIVDGQIEKHLRLVDNQKGKYGSYALEPKVGRPLGIRRLDADHLIVADSYLGLYKVDFERGVITRLYYNKIKVNGTEARFLNDVEIIDGGAKILVTDSSQNYGRREAICTAIECAPSGRVLEVNVATGETRVLVEGLYFANGIQLHPDSDSVLICESVMSRIRRFYLSGPKKGALEDFAVNLPGFPDNIRLSADRRSLFVALVGVKIRPNIMDKLGPHPLARRFLLTYVPTRLIEAGGGRTQPSYGMCLELAPDGRILHSYHDPEGKVARLSQVTDDGRALYLGSPHNNFIGRVAKVDETAA